MKLKTRLKNWIQKKIKAINDQHVTDIANQFACIYKAEHLHNLAQNYNFQGTSSENYCDNEIIVSLTTYGSRLYDVYLSIESIMQQTLKPNKIILWLSNEFKNIDLPRVLLKQQERGLEIKFCKDIKSYKKLIPTLINFPSATIITIDDDNLYYPDLIENLVNAHRKEPNTILCARMHRMKLVAKNKLEKYAKWTQLYDGFDISPLNFPTGVGGVLYPPRCFNEEVVNEAVFLDICQTADDIWFKAMALLNDTMSKKIFTHNKNGTDHFTLDNTQNTSLLQINVEKGMNDIQLQAVFDRYNLYGKLNSF